MRRADPSSWASSQSLRRVQGSVSHTLRRQVEMFKTPVLFMTTFFFVFAFLVFYRVVLEVDSDSTQRSMEHWVRGCAVPRPCGGAGTGGGG